MNDLRITVAASVDGELIEAMQRLVPQLSSSARVPGTVELQEMVSSPATNLLLARDTTQQDRIVGILTLAVFRIPTGVRAWIEDVVVDSSARGKGVGEALSREAIRLALAQGTRTVELTSRPSREAANRLYRRIGFQARETNVYRFSAPPDEGAGG
jgi:ribosomal protein S18 acetylase RimI-like enzyme